MQFSLLNCYAAVNSCVVYVCVSVARLVGRSAGLVSFPFSFRYNFTATNYVPSTFERVGLWVRVSACVRALLQCSADQFGTMEFVHENHKIR